MVKREEEIKEIVNEVLQKVYKKRVDKSGDNFENELGVFKDMETAITAAKKAQKKISSMGTEKREKIIDSIRNHLIDYVDEISKRAVEETKMGRVEDKKMKNKAAIEGTPGTENLETKVYSGKKGLTLVESAPFGVICAITPSTNPTETLICNSIGMLAAGNSVVFNPHPQAKDVSLRTIKLLNEAIQKAGGPKNVLVAVQEPTLQTVEKCMYSNETDMIVATGGPEVVEAALTAPKKAIGAAEGNPPVIVDKTAELEKAAEDIIKGASIDNNLPCTSEKVIIAVESIADQLLDYMLAGQTQLVKDPTPLEEVAFNDDGSINKEMVGKDAAYIMKQAGLKPENEDNLRLVLINVDKNHPFVLEEQLMPIIPFVRVKDFATAVRVGVEVEGGRQHTAIMHSKNVDHMTEFAQEINTTVFVKNAPSYAGFTAGGEGYATYTLAGPTGEGLTSPQTFTRKRHCVLVDGLSIV